MNDIQMEINKLFDDIEKSSLYKNYLSVKNQLHKNKEIICLIEEIKRYQKIAANNKDSMIERKIEELYLKLESYPLYQSYLIIKEDLNQELFQIKEIFNKYFNDILKL